MSETPPNTDEPKKEKESLKVVKDEAETTEETSTEEVEVEVSEEEKLIKELTEERDTFKEKYFYLAAEMENARRRFEREKENLVKFGNEKVISGLLTVIDNLDLTLQAVANEEDEKIKNIVVGVEMVRDQFLEQLKSSNVSIIETKGKNFDPKLHEALGQREEEGVEAGTILDEVQKGYVLNGRVLRAAKVMIAK
jgi:molecular chaperone GrpE